MPKYIFVTGGVVSSVGKGITVASIGTILKSRGVTVAVQKLDPYLNVDPGTMSPYQHGEVFVTKDGAETDLDLGNYERFIDIECTADSNTTSGQIYSTLISRERRGDFLGGTIQIVPHLTNEIKSRFKKLADKSGAEVILIEVGGTVGDIEGQPFLEAIRQMRNDVGRNNVFYVHVTFLPYLQSTQELKTKPTQHSVNELRRIGIQPDVIICRSDYPIGENLRDKISLFCDVEKPAVIPLVTVKTIYEIPLILEETGLGQLIVDRLGITSRDADLRDWRALVERIKTPHEPVNIALVGKYVELNDAYFSVREALYHAALHHDRSLNLCWVHSEELDRNGIDNQLRNAQGIIVPGGFGIRGIEGMIKAVRYARENKIPYFGLCLGMQVMTIELARRVFNSEEPNSTEFAPDTRYPVIDYMLEQKTLQTKGANMRLGNYPCKLVENTLAAGAYGQPEVMERHRHRLEFNNKYRRPLSDAGMIYSGVSPDNHLVEICELADHPWMLGCQFHPEFLSRPGRPHPLFRDFVGVAKNVLREGAQPPLPLAAN
ncbi:MAG: CTP synthase [Chloroflexi bacterium RBG_13_57_8]|nr:MAG: CTP synthase [Chloroflexi bacterium RBG_13_57_8]